MATLWRRPLSHSIVAVAVLSATFTACTRYRYDAPKWMLDSPNLQLRGVVTLDSKPPYRITSETRLSGSKPVGAQPTAVIASGSTGNWQWEVRAVPSLLASWEAWRRDKRFQQRSQGPDDWSHPVATWDQAFDRAYKVASYLLGRPPLPMKATVLLVPDGSSYHKVFTQSGDDFVPLTFAFYYPSAESGTYELTSERFSALVDAVSTTVYEYQHILVSTNTIEPVGTNATDKTINDETRSHCWGHSTLLALTSGTHTNLTWDPSAARAVLFAESSGQNISLETGDQQAPTGQTPGTEKRRYPDAILWARQLELKNLLIYLQERGIREPKVQSNDPAAMNAVLSFCRAITQRPRDLTAGTYAPADVEYVPFFPASFEKSK